MRRRALVPTFLSNLFIFSYLCQDLGGAAGHKLFLKSGSLVALLSHGSKRNSATDKLFILLYL